VCGDIYIYIAYCIAYWKERVEQLVTMYRLWNLYLNILILVGMVSLPMVLGYRGGGGSYKKNRCTGDDEGLYNKKCIKCKMGQFIKKYRKSRISCNKVWGSSRCNTQRVYY
jgi:hypothetical protein